MKRELTVVKNKIKKLKDKKALIDEELEPLFIREENLKTKKSLPFAERTTLQSVI